MTRTYRQDPVATEWMQLGTQAMGLGSMMNQNRRLSEDAERKRQKDLYDQQVEQALGALRNTPEGQQPQFPEGLGARALHEAESLHRRGKAEVIQLQGLGADLEKREREEALRKNKEEASLRYGQLLSRGGVHELASVEPQTIGEIMALQEVSQRWSTHEQNLNDIANRREERANKLFPVFDRDRKIIGEALTKGDKQTAAEGLMAVVKYLPVPYSLEGYDPEKNTFRVMHTALDSGETVQSGEISMEDAAKQILSLGEKDFRRHYHQNAEVITLANRDAQPKWVTGPNGENLQVLAQINVENPSHADFYVADEKGQILFKAAGTKELMERGIKLRKPESQPGLTPQQHADMMRNFYNDAHRQAKDWYSRLPQGPDGKRRDPASDQVVTEQNFQQMVEALAYQNYNRYMGGGFPSGLGGGGGVQDTGGTLEDLDPGAEERARQEKARQEREEEAAKKKAERKAVAAKTESIQKGIRENRLPEGMTWQQFIPHVLNRTGTPPAWVPAEEMAKFRANNQRQEKPMPVVDWFKNSGWTPEHGFGGPRPSQMR